MPSGAVAGDEGESRAHAAEAQVGLAAQGRHFRRAGAVLPAGAAAAGETIGRARTGAEATVHAAAAVGHGGLAAEAAAAGPGAAAGCGQEVSGRVAVLEPTPPARRPIGAVGADVTGFRTIDLMPSGGVGEMCGSGHRGMALRMHER
jgi:hypothetical protein